jgi:hypothetical protein
MYCGAPVVTVNDAEPWPGKYWVLDAVIDAPKYFNELFNEEISDTTAFCHPVALPKAEYPDDND